MLLPLGKGILFVAGRRTDYSPGEGDATKRAHLVERAELWPFSSLWAGDRPAESRVQLEKGVVTRPADWIDRVNEPLSTDELERLHVSVNRGRPYGSDRWTRATVARLGLESTMRALRPV